MNQIYDYETYISFPSNLAPDIVFVKTKRNIFIYSLPNHMNMVGCQTTKFHETCSEHGFVFTKQESKYFITENGFQVFQDALTEKGILHNNSFSLESDFILNEQRTVGTYLPSNNPDFKAISCVVENPGAISRLEYRFFDVKLGVLLFFYLYPDRINICESIAHFGRKQVNLFNFDSVCKFVCSTKMKNEEEQIWSSLPTLALRCIRTKFRI